VAGEPIILAWADLATVTAGLAQRAGTDGAPDVVVGVARGGLVPAVLLCHTLGVRDLRAVDVTHTTSDDIDATKSTEPRSSNIASLGDLGGANVLIVDDIAGTGLTLREVTRLAYSRGAARVRTAVCVLNRANWPGPCDPHQVITYIGTTVDRWVIFPWETR
jgi:hypoxanthine phosphoribosyltransferase